MLTETEIRAVYAQGEEAVVMLIKELQRQILLNGKRLDELEARINRTSRNSHKPPSSDGYKKSPSPTRKQQKKRGRKSGGQKGHEGRTLEMVSNPDETVVLSPTACDGCGEQLVGEGRRVSRGQVLDLPPIRLNVTEFQVFERQCACCGTKNRGQFPDGVVPGAQYGPRMKGLMVYLQAQQLIPQERTRQLLEDILNAPVSEGTLTRAMRMCAGELQPVLAQIKEGILNSPVAHFDETGLRTAGKLQWLHTSSTERLTLYVVDPKRGRKALDRIGILPGYRGTAVHDDYRSYNGYDCDHASCNAHHIRELEAIHEQTSQAWAKELSDLLIQAQHWKKTGRLTDFRKKRISLRYDALLQKGWRDNPYEMTAFREMRRLKRRLKRTPAQNLLRRLDENREATLRFISDPDVPFDNNLAERDLRMMKVKQKISGCFRTNRGAQNFCDVRSYISTLRKQQLGILDGLVSVFQGPILLPQMQVPAE